MGTADRWESGGPSYWDIDRELQSLRDEYGIGTRFELTPPILRVDGRGRSSWGVSLQVWKLGEDKPTFVGARSSFGYGGTWKTLPSAMLETCYEIRRKLEERAREAYSQAAF